MKMKIPLLLWCLAGCALSSRANIRLPEVLSSNMVLQQQSQVKLWGWADPGEHISITTSWDQQVYPVTTAGDAAWVATITTPAAGGPFTITLKGNNTITLQNILLGEVWVCSGQSNMEMCGNWGLKDIKAIQPAAGNNNIRFFKITKATAAHPQDRLTAQWVACDSTALNTFSAVGYFFGRKLNEQLKVPIGLIDASWGGTAAEVWTPDSIVKNNPVLKEAATHILPNGMCPHLPGVAWNAMLAPVTRYAIAGVIWYQGENNTGTAATYRLLFTSMIDAWRRAWQQLLPFYFVQIAPFNYREKNTGALLREAQQQSMQHPNTGMVVTTDITGNVYDVHPANKHDVGYRLADWALGETYHRQGFSYKNPLFKEMMIKKDKVIISFENAQQGLSVRGDSLTELFIAGNDRQFYPARATVKKNTLMVWNNKVKQPVAVRYAFSNTAIGNLFSKNGLPVVPFRTDHWEVPTK
ncbi:sialate O-acetylesterase [Chitinophaga sp. W3I9]|uniref:sialate O-acetylesterase n=1 Tax=Chitinophaga sp. W3I9 TaxID=3373924 RepID=UPI003D1CB532